ncbi:MAG TPA: DUF58 domain-containing protein [Terriglobales bacterium]|nr:DUF58 domain-containing protein [Terriglobales bacterium]
MLAGIKSLLSGVEREAWIRFFVAVAGLTVAFAAAVFSTVFREQGNVFYTAVAASAALLIAGLVAVTSVPYLARRVALERVREAFDYDVTREGVVYLVVALVIGIAALNTGNNLLFIIVSAMLAGILVSGVASAGVLRGLELEVTLPAHLFACRAVAARITLRNTRRTAPSFSVSVVPPRLRKAVHHWLWERSVFAFPGNRPPERQWFRMPDLALRRVTTAAVESGILKQPVYFPYLPARAAQTADLELRFERRGRYRQDGLGVATRFPFSFLVKTRRMPFRREVIVYPSVEPTDEFFEVLPLITGEFEAFVRGRGYDLYRIREYMPEDSARHVDWKATAKSMSLKVREFTREDERKLRIVWDNPPPDAVPADAYENAVALGASLAWHFAGEDTDLSFAAAGYPGGGDVYDFLRYLALVQPADAPSVLDALEVTDDYNVILTARARGSIPTRLWACSYFIFLEKDPDAAEQRTAPSGHVPPAAQPGKPNSHLPL